MPSGLGAIGGSAGAGALGGIGGIGASAIGSAGGSGGGLGSLLGMLGMGGNKGGGNKPPFVPPPPINAQELQEYSALAAAILGKGGGSGESTAGEDLDQATKLLASLFQRKPAATGGATPAAAPSGASSFVNVPF